MLLWQHIFGNQNDSSPALQSGLPTPKLPGSTGIKPPRQPTRRRRRKTRGANRAQLTANPAQVLGVQPTPSTAN